MRTNKCANHALCAQCTQCPRVSLRDSHEFPLLGRRKTLVMKACQNASNQRGLEHAPAVNILLYKPCSEAVRVCRLPVRGPGGVSP